MVRDMKIKRWIITRMFNLLEYIDSDTVFDLCVYSVEGTGDWGYCEDCDRPSGEPRWCR